MTHHGTKATPGHPGWPDSSPLYRYVRDKSPCRLPHSLETRGSDELLSTQRHDNLRLGGTIPQALGVEFKKLNCHLPSYSDCTFCTMRVPCYNLDRSHNSPWSEHMAGHRQLTWASHIQPLYGNMLAAKYQAVATFFTEQSSEN